MSKYDTLSNLVAIDSPTGYTEQAANYVHELLSSYGYKPTFTNKGAVKCALGPEPVLSIAAHIDTLGAIVSGITSNGHLRFSKLGGLSINMAEGEYCRIHTLDGKTFTGTLLLDNPSVHVNKQVASAQRSTENTFIRIDEPVESAEDTEKLGIRVGDIICFDTRYQHLPNGFIKGRYMDNKAGCYVLFEIARRLKEQNIEAPVELFFSNYEETGHGASSGYATTISEMLVIDMGVVGDNVEGSEMACSICAKDSTGPYDYGFRKQLVQLCEKQNIPFKLDIYPFYGSDGSAALRAGHNFRVALIGPGVAASHGVERTHEKGIEATIDLCLAYIKSRFNG